MRSRCVACSTEFEEGHCGKYTMGGRGPLCDDCYKVAMRASASRIVSGILSDANAFVGKVRKLKA